MLKLKLPLFLMLMVVILAGCSTSMMDEPVTLLNQDNQEISFPQEKPTLFFFITTYT